MEVLGLHGEGRGFGVAFRLRVMASVAGSAEDVPNLLGLPGDEEGGRGLGWGAWEHGLSGRLLAEPEGLPRKLGRIVSGSSRPGHAGGRPVVPLTAGRRGDEAGCLPPVQESEEDGRASHGQGQAYGHNRWPLAGRRERGPSVLGFPAGGGRERARPVPTPVR